METQIRLAPLEPGDFPTLVRWTTSPEFLVQWAGPAFSYPLTAAQLEEHYRGCLESPPKREMWKAVESEGGQMVAHAELNGIDRKDLRATVSRVIVGDSKSRGKGIGTALMRALVSRAFDDLGLASLDLNVFDFNRRAIDCYLRVGFKIESRLENVQRVGDTYWSVYRMVLARPPSP